jgi:hypothetical protein
MKIMHIRLECLCVFIFKTIVMKEIITLSLFLFISSFYSFGQSVVKENNENREKYNQSPFLTFVNQAQQINESGSFSQDPKTKIYSS